MIRVWPDSSRVTVELSPGVDGPTCCCYVRTSGAALATARVSGGSRELVDRALARRLVVSPADDRRAVADAPVARVVISDLDDELRAQRDPLELAFGRPAARVGAAALARLVGRELGDQLALAFRREAGAVAYRAQRPVGLVEAEDQGADRALGGTGPVPHHHAVDRALALDLDHRRALPRRVGGV